MSSLAFRLSRSIQATNKPPIPQAYKWADSYAPTPTRPLLDMSQGVPGVPPPKPLLEAIALASASPASCGYVPNAGEASLRAAVVEETQYVYGKHADVTVDDAAITAGCNLAFSAVAMTLAEKNDEFILPVPWYFNHEMTLTMLGIKPVLLHTSSEDNFLPSVERCAQLITEKTKAIVLVTPNNPTGAIYPPALLASFAALAHAHKIALVLDETYRDFVLTKPPHTLFSPSPPPSLPDTWSWRQTVIHLFSFSKSYCIPGHRVGLVLSAPAFHGPLTTALDNIQICAPRPPQLALASLLPSLRPFVHDMALALAGRHALFKESLPSTWRVGAQGGYYAFVKHPFVGVSAVEVCRRLAGEMGVVSLPASFFGCEEDGDGQRWVRFSVANVSDEQVRRVCERLKESEQAFGWKLEC